MAIGLYKANSWQVQPVSSYGYLEPRFYAQSWRPKKGGVGDNDVFEIDRVALKTRNCTEADLNDNFFSSEQQALIEAVITN